MKKALTGELPCVSQRHYAGATPNLHDERLRRMARFLIQQHQGRPTVWGPTVTLLAFHFGNAPKRAG